MREASRLQLCAACVGALLWSSLPASGAWAQSDAAAALAGPTIAEPGNTAVANSEPTAAESSTPLQDVYAGMSLEELLNVQCITASGGEAEFASATAATVTTFTKDDIANYGWHSLAELLANVPGLHVIDDLVQPSLSVRGLSGGLRAGTRLVRIMINGVQVNFRPDLTAFIGPEFLPMEAIERVEIAKGPLSSLYGANAFLATINVITKTPGRGLHADLGGQGTWQLSSRSQGYGAHAVVGLGGETVDLLAAASGDHLDRSGLSVQKTFDNQSQTPTRFPFFSDVTRNDIARPSSSWLKLDIKSPRLGTLTAQGGMQKLDSSGELLLNSVLTHANRVSLYNHWSNLAYSKQWAEALHTEASVGWSRGAPSVDTRFILPGDDTYFYVPQYGYRALGADASARLTLTRFSVKVGGDYESNQEDVLWYKSIPFVPGSPEALNHPETTRRTLLNGGLYVAANATPFESLSMLRFTANARLDRLVYGPVAPPWQTSWRLAASYRHSDDLTLKVFGGRSFQGPSGVLMFTLPGVNGFGPSNNIIGQYESQALSSGDKVALRPQVVQSVETAITGRVLDMLSIEASGFYQQISDTIQFESFNNNFLAVNGAATRFVGGEATLRIVVSRFSGKLAGSLVHPLAPADSNVEPLPAIPLYPELQLFAGADVAVPEAHVHLAVLGRLVGKRGASEGNTILNQSRFYTLPAYGDFDVAISTRNLRLLGDATDTVMTFAVRNVIGQTHSEPGFGGLDYPSVGRMLYLQLRQQL